LTLTTTILPIAPRRGKNEGDIRGIVSSQNTSFFCWGFSVISGESAAGDGGHHRGPSLIHGEGVVDLKRVGWVFAIRDRICLFCLVGYPEEMFSYSGEEFRETAVERGSSVRETLKRAQRGRAKHIFPHITIVTGGVFNIHPADFGGESPSDERVDIDIDLDNETMLMLNRSPPLTGESSDSQIFNKTSNCVTVLKEGKTLDKDKITSLPKRGDTSRPTHGDLRDIRGGFPLTKLIVLFTIPDNRKPRATDLFVYPF
jgi:hypothetical protein